MKDLGIFAAVAFLLLILTLVAMVPWLMDDMRDQPSVKPQQARVALPAGSVPAQPAEIAASPRDGAELVRARLRAAELANPVPANDDSLARGALVYETHCQTCHGAGGMGDGPVGRQYVPEPIDLTLPYVQNQPDGRLFYTISHGGLVMPHYRDAIAAEDRWHLVNYVKHAIGDQ